MSEHVVIETRDRICRMVMNRPEKKNALTLAMYTAMSDAMAAAEADPQIRVLYITGTGASFTSGNDVLDFMQSPPEGDDSPVVRFLRALASGTKPLVAAVNGLAIGIGTTMLLHCDLAYAARRATFRTPFVNLGLCPEAGSSLLLPRLMGHVRAAELLLLGDTIPAARALELGLLNEVVDDDALEAHAWAKAQQLAVQPPAAVRLAKRLMRGPLHADLPRVMEDEGREFLARLTSPEAAEAMTAFLERRKPDFSAFA